MREYEKPTIEKTISPVSETVEKHPAYAQIGASRVSGGAYLYGSDFDHQHYLTITISRSELNRGLSNDRPHPREELIEVALSEAQWANFVSCLNQGSGTQCTLQHIDRVGIPQIEKPIQRQGQFKKEVKDRLQRATDELKALRKAIEESKLTGPGRKALFDHLIHVENDMNSNIAFVADQFGEHIEKVTEHAKIEVNAYIQQSISRAGLTALQGTSPIRLIASDDDAPHLSRQQQGGGG